MAQSDLTKTVRYGIESTRGTSVPCTAILDISDAEWEIIPPTVRSDNLTGGVYPSLVTTAGVIIPRVKVKLGSINWDKWQKWLASGVNGGITSVGAGADKVWTGTNGILPPAVSTGGALVEALKSFTLEFGYANPSAANPAHKITGAVVERIKIVWQKVGFVTAEIDFVSISTVTDITAYTGTLSPDVMSAAVPDHSMFKAYVDASTIGTTLDATIVSAEVEWKSFMAVDDNAKRLTIGKVADVSAKFTRFWEAADQLAAVRTKGVQKYRFTSIGPSLGSTNWELGADIFGLASSRTLPSMNGFVGEEITVESKRDATVGSDIGFRLTNSVSAI